MELKQKRFRHPLLGLSVLIFAIIGALFLKQHFSNPNTSPANQPGSNISADSGKSPAKKDLAPSNGKPSEEIPASQTGTINIILLNQSSGYVNARAEVSNFNPKQCVYSFTIAGGKPIVREQLGGCSSISIPQGEFDRIGVYTLVVTAYSDNEKLTASKEINVQ